MNCLLRMNGIAIYNSVFQLVANCSDNDDLRLTDCFDWSHIAISITLCCSDGAIDNRAF